MADIEFLIGPMVRRASASAVHIFLATPNNVSLRGEIYAIDTSGVARALERGGRTGPPRATATNLATSAHARWRLGPGMTAHLLKLTPLSGRTFPTGQVLGYDVLIDPGKTSLRSHPERADFVLPPLELPSFVLQAGGTTLRALQGSCRKMHGGATDAMVATDRELIRSASRVEERPSVLFLTGDQIYADDVAAPLMKVLLELSRRIRGGVDAVPGLPPLAGVRLSERQRISTDLCKFTSNEAANHLFTFGEYAAMYALAWNPRLWPRSMPTVGAHEIPQTDRINFIGEYSKQVRKLEEQRPRVLSARRVLANVASYMMWDDHEITDDWFLTEAWKAAVRGSPSGKRVIANGIGAFAVFQAWGNTPDRFASGDGGTLREQMQLALAAGPVAGSGTSNFDDLAWTFSLWAFATPTDPLGYMLNTRTQRASTRPPAAGDAPRLMDDSAWRLMQSECASATGKPFIVIAPAPIYGFTAVESPLGMAMRISQALADMASVLQAIARAGDLLAANLALEGVKHAVDLTADLTRRIAQLMAQTAASISDLLELVEDIAQHARQGAEAAATAVEAVAAMVTQYLRQSIADLGPTLNFAARAILQELLDIVADGSSHFTRILRGISATARAAELAVAALGPRVNQLMLSIAARAGIVLSQALVQTVIPAILALAERLQSVSGTITGVAGAVGPVPAGLGSTLDFESWDANLANFLDFGRALRAIAPKVCVVLSGDVHYATALAVRLHYAPGGGSTPLAQLTSSATNNSPGKLGLALKGLSLYTQILLSQPATTFLWGGMPPMRAGFEDYTNARVRMGRSPDIIETRHFEADVFPGQGPVLTDGNMGLLSVDSGGTVRHCHLVEDGNRTRRVMSVRWEPDNWPV